MHILIDILYILYKSMLLHIFNKARLPICSGLRISPNWYSPGWLCDSRIFNFKTCRQSLWGHVIGIRIEHLNPIAELFLSTKDPRAASTDDPLPVLVDHTFDEVSCKLRGGTYLVCCRNILLWNLNLLLLLLLHLNLNIGDRWGCLAIND